MPKLFISIIFGIGVYGISYQYNKKFIEWFRFQSLGTRDFIVERLNMMFIDIPREKILMWLMIMSIVPGLIVLLVFLPKLFPGVPFAMLTMVFFWKIPKPIVNYMYRRRCEKFVLQMVDALSLMSNGMKSNLSIVQAMALVINECPNPMRQEFNLVLSENRLGVSLEEAFINLSRRIPNDDVEMFVTSVNILKETGGNLAETFDTIVTTLRERIKIEQKISTITAQGFYQSIFVMIIPFALGLCFYLSDPAFMQPLFTTALGWVIVSLILALEIVGFFVVMKIVNIDV